VQIIQPEFAGAVQSIAVKDGQRVQAGDVLVRIDDRDASADLERLQKEGTQLRIEALRIEAIISVLGSVGPDTNAAQISSAKLSLPADLEALPFAAQQTALFRTEVQALSAILLETKAQRESSQRGVEVGQAELGRISAALSTSKERFDSTKTLYDNGTANRRAYLDALDAYTTLQKESEVARRTVAEKQSLRVTLDANLQSQITTRQNTLQERASEIDRRLEVLASELRSATRRVDATELRAPHSGVVDQLKVYTVGGIAQAGEELLRIVPDDGRVEIEAVFSNADIGFLEKAQLTRLRFDAYPAARFGTIEGQVVDVSADAKEINAGQFGYTVRIEPSTGAFQIAGKSYPLSAGMTMDVDVVMQKRRIISYFIQPLIDSFQRSLREK
jgi:hemolysin D